MIGFLRRSDRYADFFLLDGITNLSLSLFFVGQAPTPI